jgi:hypothetical protein
MNNLFWSVYTNLEKEVLYLADLVHFDDKQLSVYSVRIADLLIRCNVEAESLIKELYRCENGDTLDKIGAMLVSLNDDWTLSKKQVSVASANMHFSSFNTTFCPYGYKPKKENDFYHAYNAVKHDRAENFAKYATLHYLLRALGALFILNIYYNGESFHAQRSKISTDTKMKSSIFSFETTTIAPKYPYQTHRLNDDELKAMYIVKPTAESFRQYYDEAEAVFLRQVAVLKGAGYVSKDENGEEQEISYEDRFVIAARLGDDVVRRIATLEESVTKKHTALSYETILSKSSVIQCLPK